MTTSQPVRIKTISEFHRMRNLPAPEHPLISVLNVHDFQYPPETRQLRIVMDFYSISLKRNCGKIRYGQQQYDFDEGVLYFIAPNQVFQVEHNPEEPKQSGRMLLIHPDFLWKTPLAKTIHNYEFFSYSVNEALFLSEKEEAILLDILQNIQLEYNTNIDPFYQRIIASQIETFLHYSERFYQRQFITRKPTNHQLLNRLNQLITDYFNNEALSRTGLPSVQYIADQLHVSQGYLSSLLKHLTGQSTQYHIHQALIEKAKIKLSTTNLSISEIAYELGFEHPQSFSKLFRAKTNFTPLEFRQSF
ncbi:response regulator transcription factor [Flavihumibacter sp. CACIAM 22H1]|uniref:helix-turn-helix domain-containing protein n=1 Tax=Flavihumibacter sp. CACIAM 22H1 TaxID=1812911 RepID=UPI0007A82274|nr:response regulator transcription factor [Flavihumibacter sp. CACIAM 22H1]KYP15575.1 MAG: AraC family transcriptional regulator [Flavihumibacter sp. CACIAM 22H1]